MAFTSTIQILKTESIFSRKIDPSTQKPYEFKVARVALINDDGELETVGRLRVPRELEEVVVKGIFRATFALQVPDYGDNKGDVVSVLTGLVPVPPARSAAPAPAPAAVSKG